MKNLLATASMFMGLYAACAAAELPQVIQTTDGFTLNIPADWKPIPKDILETYSANLARLVPQMEKQVYKYGFQRSGGTRWFEYPYILVQVKQTGRIPESQLKSIKRVQQSMKQGIEKVQGALSTVTSNAQVGETIYDESAHVLWTSVSMEVKDVGVVKGLTALMLTTKGAIQINAYNRLEEYEASVPVFESIVKSCKLDEKLQYKPRVTDSIPSPGGIDLSQVVIGAGIGGVVGGLFGLLRKKKNT